MRVENHAEADQEIVEQSRYIESSGAATGNASLQRSKMFVT
jgi:hypothetical protein